MRIVLYALAFIANTGMAGEPYMWGVGASAGYALSTNPNQVTLGFAAVAHHHRHLQYALEADVLFGIASVGVRSVASVEAFWPVHPMGISVGGATGVEVQFRKAQTGARQQMRGVPVHLRVGLHGSWDIYRTGVLVYGGPTVPVRVSGSRSETFGTTVPWSFGVVYRVLWGDFTPPRKPKYFDATRPQVDD